LGIAFGGLYALNGQRPYSDPKGHLLAQKHAIRLMDWQRLIVEFRTDKLGVYSKRNTGRENPKFRQISHQTPTQ